MYGKKCAHDSTAIDIFGCPACLNEEVERLKEQSESRWKLNQSSITRIGVLETEVRRLKVEDDVNTSCIVESNTIINRLREALGKAKQAFKEASEERYELLEEWRQEAEKWKREGDMYGWNFHMGMSGGANWADIVYQRVNRVLEEALKGIEISGDSTISEIDPDLSTAKELEFYKRVYRLRGEALKSPCSHCGKTPMMIHLADPEALKYGEE